MPFSAPIRTYPHQIRAGAEAPENAPPHPLPSVGGCGVRCGGASAAAGGSFHRTKFRTGVEIGAGHDPEGFAA